MPNKSEPCDRFYKDTFVRENYTASIRDNQGYIDHVSLERHAAVQKAIADKLHIDLSKIPKE